MGRQKAITLASLLELNGRFRAPGALPDSLGDAYLYAHNPVFRNLRDLVKRAGYSLARDDELFYRCGAFATLPRILESKVIPYYPTVPHLEELERRCPGEITADELDSVAIVVHNVLIHESAHGIVNTLFPPASGSRRARVLRHQLGEAFALAAEAMGSIQANSEEHRFYFLVNAHPYLPTPAAGRALAVLQAERGFKFAFKLLMMIFFYSIFLYKSLETEELARIAALLEEPGGFRRSERASVRSLLHYVFSLNPAFRVSTTGLFFKLVGIRGDVFKILEFDPLVAIGRDPELLGSFEILSDLALLGLHSQHVFALDRVAGGSRVQSA